VSSDRPHSLATKYAYNGYKIAHSVTRQKRFEGLFGVKPEEPLKKVAQFNYLLEARMGEM